MIEAAIVEDETREAENLAAMMQRYSAESGGTVQFKTTRFAGSIPFLEGYTQRFDIVFMDIELPDLDGMKAARRLRETDQNVMIVFVTNMAQYAIKGYEVRAFDFVVKPVAYKDFAMKMTSALECIGRKRGKEIWVSNKDGKRGIRTSDIKYIEVVQHMLIYHTVHGDIRASGALSLVENELSGEPFAYCNRCYYVNLRYVTAVHQYDVYLGGEKLQISRMKRAPFMSALNNFLAGGD